jgi:hypothetical protein
VAAGSLRREYAAAGLNRTRVESEFFFRLRMAAPNSASL